LVYVDNTDIIGRSKSDIKKAYVALKIAAETKGIRVNKEKIEHVVVKKDIENSVAAPSLHTDSQKF
jgi:hypothetical protein